MSDLTGQTLGNYRIVERIGRGGMAVVYKAYQPALERHVAIKVLREQLTADDEQFARRFQREAKAVAALRHPNIVQVFDFGVQDDVSYMVMEYLDGTTLKAELNALAERGETMALQEAQHIFQAVASAVDYAHSQGMVHRDIKPANVMLTAKGDVVLTDFGIARIVGGTQYTATGAVIGTPAYLSPEQGQGERGDERSDIYALGVVLYEMVTGRVPFDADTPLAVIFKHISDPLPLPHELNPDVPEAVEHVILKALAKDPNERYQRMADMAGALIEAMIAESAKPNYKAPVSEASMVGEIAAPDAVFSSLDVTPALTGESFTPAAAVPSGQGLQFSRSAWRGIALLLFLIAMGWGACGLLLGRIPLEATENMPNPEGNNFWITRGCCIGPAFVLLCLAYLSFMAGRGARRTVRWSEVVTVLVVAVGLFPMLLGLAMVLQPVSDESDRVFAPLLCITPGFFIVGLAGVFWTMVVRKK
jgi:tRNA A-37 threonylcarbamoyl transferase component Bud32